jgi:hypothetical protein
VTPADARNRPRWPGGGGCFEIWFLVVFDPGAARAWWLRYTLFAPADPNAGAARATVWAAAFDARATPRAVAGKRILPLSAYASEPDRFGVRLGTATLERDVATGEVRTDRHTLAWELRWTAPREPARRGPAWLDHVPAPTRVAHVGGDLRCSGWFAVDGKRQAIDDAPGLQKHIWGTRRVRELYWLACPTFGEDAGASLEATSVRVDAGRGPWLSPVWLRTGQGEASFFGVPELFRSRVEPDGPGRLIVRAHSSRHRLVARARCDPASLVGYVYRDPSGWDVHVAQSDVASCEVELASRRHRFAAWSSPTRLSATHAAAVEFHQPTPLPGVRYIPWDGVDVPT